jgi:WD40 repeat protein
MTITAAVRWGLDIGEPVITLAPLPDGVVAGGSEGTIAVIDLEGTERLRLCSGEFLLGLAASPDGTRVAVGGGEQVSLWNLTDGCLLARHAARWSAALAWTARSDRIAVGDGRQVRVLDRNGRHCWAAQPLPSTVAGLAWLRRDGRRITAAAYQGVTILEPAADRVVGHLPAPGSIAGLAVAPNGRWVVGGSQDATLHGWKIPDGDDFRMSGFPTTVSRLAFAPDGRWMACDGGDTVAFWDFSHPGPTGREAVLGQGHRATVAALTWAESGRRLATGDAAGDIAVWELERATGPGDRIRPLWTESTHDPVEAIAYVNGHLVSGHRSGMVRCAART